MGNCQIETSSVEGRLDLTQHEPKALSAGKRNPDGKASDSFDLCQHEVLDVSRASSVFTADLENDVNSNYTNIKTKLHTLPIGNKSGAVSFAGCSVRGFSCTHEKENQDSIMMFYDSITETLIVACFDGHGDNGGKISKFVRDKIQVLLTSHPAFSSNLRTAIKDTLSSVESILIQRFYKECAFSGTTLTLAAIRNSVLLVANIGDSRVILCSSNTAEQISIDHKADLPAERARIEKFGGRVIVKTYEDGYIGPPRVCLGSVDIPGLAMSRSMGDSLCHEVGVSSEPDIFKRQLTDADQFLIVASDGIWDFTSNQEVADITSAHSSPEFAIGDLLSQSYSKWQANVEGVMDDTSVVIVSFRSLNLST